MFNLLNTGTKHAWGVWYMAYGYGSRYQVGADAARGVVTEPRSSYGSLTFGSLRSRLESNYKEDAVTLAGGQHGGSARWAERVRRSNRVPRETNPCSSVSLCETQAS